MKQKRDFDITVSFTRHRSLARHPFSPFPSSSRSSPRNIFTKSRKSAYLPTPASEKVPIHTLVDVFSERTLRGIRKTGHAFQQLSPVPAKNSIQNEPDKSKAQFALIQQMINKLDASSSPEDRPSRERIDAVFDALLKMGEERSVFQDYMLRIAAELRRAIFFRVGEFPMLLNFERLDCEGQDCSITPTDREEADGRTGEQGDDVLRCAGKSDGDI